MFRKEDISLKIREQLQQKRQQSKGFRILTSKYTLATVVFVAISLFFSDNGLLFLLQKKADLRQQREAIHWYDQEIHRLDRRLEQLTQEKDSIEQYAREHYLFHEPDEVIYVVVDEE